MTTPPLTTVRERISLIIAGRWMPLYRIQHELRMEHDIHISESNVGARVRELRNPKYGSWPVKCQAVSLGGGKRRFEYRIDV